MSKEAFEKAGLFEISPCSKTLGFELLSLDLKSGTTRVRFDGSAEFVNPAGFIQGGFLSAMLDDTIGMLGMVKLAGSGNVSTIDLMVQYLRPVRIGKIEVAARIISTGRTAMFAEAELFDARGKLATRATSSMAILRYKSDNGRDE